jgi:predicted nucleic acid-binding Zn ribbon protein
MPRTCQREGCGKALPPTAATQRKYCSERCQVAEWRRKKRELDAPKGNQ